jgi:hypothetical protein
MADADKLETRLTRIETRLARFMIALGVDPYGESHKVKAQRIKLRADYRLEVPTLDVSLLDLRQFISSKNLAPGTYDVLQEGVVVATIVFPT